jgi:hypothetical protein
MPEQEESHSNEDEREERDIRYLNYIFAFVVLSGILLSSYTFFFNRSLFTTSVAVFTGLTLGVIVAYYYYASFSAEDKQLLLGPDEQVLLELSGGKSYISVPSMQGGYLGENPPIKANLFLTNKGLLVEPLEVQEFDDEGRLYYLQISHSDILRLAHESSFMAEYIRLTYRGPQMQEQDILLFAGKETPKLVDGLTNFLGMRAV